MFFTHFSRNFLVPQRAVFSTFKLLKVSIKLCVFRAFLERFQTANTRGVYFGLQPSGSADPPPSLRRNQCQKVRNKNSKTCSGTLWYTCVFFLFYRWVKIEKHRKMPKNTIFLPLRYFSTFLTLFFVTLPVRGESELFSFFVFFENNSSVRRSELFYSGKTRRTLRGRYFVYKKYKK